MHWDTLRGGRVVARLAWATGTVLLVAASGWAQEAASPAAATQPAAPALAVFCPVTGKPVDWKCTARFRGKWVYFADADARKQFEADPFEYAPAVMRQWEANVPLRTQVRCPVTGEAVDPAVYTGAGLDAVYFATPAARDQWLADAEPYASRLKRECYTFQTLCAHSERPIDPRVWLDREGRRLYFYCPNCRAAFEAELPEVRARLLKRVDEQVREHERLWYVRHGGEPAGAADRLKALDERRAELGRLLGTIDRELADIEAQIAARQKRPDHDPRTDPLEELQALVVKLKKTRVEIEWALFEVEKELGDLRLKALGEQAQKR